MISRLKLFNDLLVECAVCQIAVDEFEIIDGEDNEAILRNQQEELDNVKLAVIELIAKEGSAIRNQIYEERSKRINSQSTRWITKFP